MKKLNAYQKIQQGMKEHEKWIMKAIRKTTSEGKGWSFHYATHATYNALDRLKAKDLIRYSKTKMGYIAMNHARAK